MRIAKLIKKLNKDGIEISVSTFIRLERDNLLPFNIRRSIRGGHRYIADDEYFYVKDFLIKAMEKKKKE